MDNFCFFNPTKIYFGKGAIANLTEELDNYGTTVLLTYGGGSIKNNGLYQQITDILKLKGKRVFELKGITPNPRVEKVYEGIKLCKENNVDLILAVGGGSVIDCSKAIAIGAKTDKDFWQSFYIDKEEATDKIPLATVLTLAGTGSEMNNGSVVSNDAEKRKTDYHSTYMQPEFSVLDPVYTLSLPTIQMVSGAIDILSHLMEQYFSEPICTNVSDDLGEALMKSVIKNLQNAVCDPADYNSRSNLMWDATLGLNGLTKPGKVEDWQVHMIEHQLTAYCDVTHGLGLAIISPSYYRYVYKYGLPKFVDFAKNVFNVDTEDKSDDEIALEGIERLEQFFINVGSPTQLREIGVNKDHLKDIAYTTELLTDRGFKSLTAEDIYEILLTAY